MTRFDWQAGGPGAIEINQDRLEYACHGPPPDKKPTIILLHEGLGCVALWRDFPQRLSQATGLGVFAYSRAGYGQSDPVSLPRPLDYMTREAVDLLQELFDAIGVKRFILLGHSDGASIAAVYAGNRKDARLAGVVLIAPHFFTEPEGLASIRAAKDAYEKGDLRKKLGRYHRDPDNAFYGWNTAWLDPGFERWNIADAIDGFTVPVLAIQGKEDQYGTLAQVYEIEKRSPLPVTLKILPGCGHAPHLEKTEETLAAIQAFADTILAPDGSVREKSNAIRIAEDLPLPDHAHLPGINARSGDSVLEEAKQLAPAQTRSRDWQDNAAWLYGVRLLREGFYWEAHEVLETVWMNAAPNSREKALVQALIHGANARLKRRLGMSNAARRLVALSKQACERAYEGQCASLLGLGRKRAIGFCTTVDDDGEFDFQ